MNNLERLIARAEIQDSMCRYARGVDRRDWESVRRCFHPDAVDEHGELVGSPDDFIEWVSRRHAAIPFAVHFLGNCLIEFIDDRSAAVETYFIAVQRRETAPGDTGTDFEVFGRYLDRFERRDGEWRVAARKVVYDGSRTMPSTNHLRSLTGIMGRRDVEDPVFSEVPSLNGATG